MVTVIEDVIMVNKIYDSSNIKPADPDKRLSSKEMNKTDKTTESLLKPDHVNLSIESKQLEALKASLVNVSEMNKARIEYFKSEIASGNYKINSDNIASRMLNNLELA